MKNAKRKKILSAILINLLILVILSGLNLLISFGIGTVTPASADAATSETVSTGIVFFGSIGRTIAFGVIEAIIIAVMVLVNVRASRGSSKMVRYFREMWGEIKKLSWLSVRDLVKHVVAVIVFVLVMSAVVYGLDVGFGGGVQGISILTGGATPEPVATEAPSDLGDMLEGLDLENPELELGDQP